MTRIKETLIFSLVQSGIFFVQAVMLGFILADFLKVIGVCPGIENLSGGYDAFGISNAIFIVYALFIWDGVRQFEEPPNSLESDEE